jgi:hypothetical protein
MVISTSKNALMAASDGVELRAKSVVRSKPFALGSWLVEERGVVGRVARDEFVTLGATDKVAKVEVALNVGNFTPCAAKAITLIDAIAVVSNKE